MFKNFGKDYLKGLFYFYGTIIFILAVISGIAYKYFPAQISNWSSVASIGQFLIEFFLVPFAIIAFLTSLVDLRKSMQYCELDVHWDNENGLAKSYNAELVKSKKYTTNSIILTNTGNNPSLYYQVVIDVPKENIWPFKITGGSWNGHKYNEYERFIYRGSELNISFPDSPIELGKIEFSDSAKLPKKLTIPYYISSDKGEYKKGYLVIIFEDK